MERKDSTLEQEKRESISTVIFDADGVVIDTVRIDTHMLNDFGIPLEKSKEFFLGEFENSLLGKSDVVDLLPPYLKSWDIPMDPEQFVKYWLQAENNVNSQLIEYIQNLREQGTKCFVATNQEKRRVEYMKNTMGFANHFDGLFSSSALGVKKPDIEFYRKMHQELEHTLQGEILFWDDTPRNVESATKYGLIAEQYTTFEDFAEKMKHYNFRSS